MMQSLHLWRILATFVFLSFLVIPSTAQTFFYSFCLVLGGNFTQNSTYEANLNKVLKQLKSKATVPGTKFSNSTAGSGPDTVYALFYCRSDLPSQQCQSCVEHAATRIREDCPNQKESIIWYEQCTLRYANRTIFSEEEESPWSWSFGEPVNSGNTQFNVTMEATIDSLINEVAPVGQTKLEFFGTKEVKFTTLQTVYILVQCTPDITAFGCNRCLRRAWSDVGDCCGGAKWVKMFLPSCQLRYDLAPFYETNTPPAISPTPVEAPPIPPPPAVLNATKSSDGARTSPSTLDVVVINILMFVASLVVLIPSL
ncbi:hypothetical protein Ancab_033638 [Ancistrocladus abbreviatus]